MPQAVTQRQRYTTLAGIYARIFLASFGVSALVISLVFAGAVEVSSVLLAALFIATASILLYGILAALPLQKEIHEINSLIERQSITGKSPSPTRLHQLEQTASLLENKHRYFQRRFANVRKAAERMRRIFEQANDTILLVDRESRLIVDCNSTALDLLGYPLQTLVSEPIDKLTEQPSVVRAFLEGLNDQSQQHHLTTQFKASNGHYISLDLSASMLEGDDNPLILLIGRDLSEHENAQYQIQHLAYHDTLTDLPNRTLLTDRVNRALKRSQRSQQIGALLFIDLDNFKRINDSLGHSVGDLLLQELSARLRGGLREEDTISRLGGDEFVILIEQLGTEQHKADQQVEEIASKVRNLMGEEYELNGHELHITGSIGYVTFPRDGESMETLLRHADLAMYTAKTSGRDTVTRFTNEMDEKATHRMRLEKEVRNAMRRGELVLYFQPVLRIRDGFMLGAETLLRWIHPEDGVIKPDEFLPMIEDSALMLKLADWVMREAFSQQASIAADRELLRPDYIAINLGHQQFHQPNFVSQVEQMLEETGADPKRILFEITETIIMDDTHEARKQMLALKQLGFRFAIDDFGTGYSSLAYLKQLPADTLKIDRGFVKAVAKDEDDAAIVRTILGIADHMNLDVIAEGVENYDQLDFLRSNGCTYYQGYLGRPPLSQMDFIDDLRQSQRLKLVN